MPPKSAKARPKTSKTKGKEKDSDTLTPAEKISKMQTEIETLQRELEFRQELIERLRANLAEVKDRNRFLEMTVENKDQDRMDVTSDMTRQFQFMHHEMLQKILAMESTIDDNKRKIAEKDKEIVDMRESTKQQIEKKDAQLLELEGKLEYLSQEFENMLHETLEKMTKKLENVSTKWQEDSNLTDINQRRLADFNMTQLQLTHT